MAKQCNKHKCRRITGFHKCRRITGFRIVPLQWGGFDGRLRDVLRYVQDLIAEYGEDAVIDIEGHDYSVTLQFEVLETDAEYARRLKNEQAAREREKARKAEKKEKEYEEYLRLKKKFGEPT